MGEPTVGPDGVLFTWNGGDRPHDGQYGMAIGRRINGVVGWGDYFSVGESLHEYVVPWTASGVKADGVGLIVGIGCVNGQHFDQKWVNYSVYRAQADAAAAAEQAAIDAQVAQQVAQQTAQQQVQTPPRKKRVECVNKKTDEIKTFARWRCPRGWKKF